MTIEHKDLRFSPTDANGNKHPFVNTYVFFQNDREKFRETNDCTVISFATVWGIGYAEARRYLREKGRRLDRRGLKHSMMLKLEEWKPEGTKIRKGPYTKKNKISVGRFCKEHPVGRYWVCVGGHALAVIDGVVYDHSNRPRRMVSLAYRIHPKEI